MILTWAKRRGIAELGRFICDYTFLLLKKIGSRTLYSLLRLEIKNNFIKMRLMVAGGGFLFYFTTLHIKLYMESQFVQIKRVFNQSIEFNAFGTKYFFT